MLTLLAYYLHSAVCMWVHVRKMQFCAALQILPNGTICTPCLQECRVRTPYLGDNLFAGLFTCGGVGGLPIGNSIFATAVSAMVKPFFSSRRYNTFDDLKISKKNNKYM
jgi:hypothetical protein